jgi:hypothetical protein
MTHFKLKLSVKTLDIYVKEEASQNLKTEENLKFASDMMIKFSKLQLQAMAVVGKQPPSELVSRFLIGPQDMA